MSGFSSKTELVYTHSDTYTRIRNWLTQLWGLASPKSVGHAGSLEIQGRVNVAVLTPNFVGAGWKLGQDFYVAVLRLNFFFIGEPQLWLLRSSIDWVRPT